MDNEHEIRTLQLIREILADVVKHLSEVDPTCTLTARRHIATAILEIERQHATRH